jgi:hypothetical protein
MHYLTVTDHPVGQVVDTEDPATSAVQPPTSHSGFTGMSITLWIWSSFLVYKFHMHLCACCPLAGPDWWLGDPGFMGSIRFHDGSLAVIWERTIIKFWSPKKFYQIVYLNMTCVSMTDQLNFNKVFFNLLF